MSKSNIQQEFLIQMPYYNNYLIVDDNKSKVNRRLIILASITEEIEKELDELENEVYTLNCGTKSFKLTHRHIYCYGEIDLNDENTCKIINNFNFLDYLFGVGIPIYSKYDYTTHTCKSPKCKPLWTETWDPIDLIKYGHGCLCKPERIILFKYNPDDKTIQKKR